MKYIDADKLIAEIDKKWRELADKNVKIGGGKYDIEISTYLSIKNLIISLQQEQSEVDVVSAAKTFLDALSKTPYNNKPITDAQIIVKQLLSFFENPKEYNPDAILEQPESIYPCCWKPSEKQIMAVEAAYSVLNSHDTWGEDEHLPVLMSLINDLQKLL